MYVGKVWVDGNKELVVGIVEFARKEPFVQGGKEGFGHLFGVGVRLPREEGKTNLFKQLICELANKRVAVIGVAVNEVN